jgi:hypothetical protein
MQKKRKRMINVCIKWRSKRSRCSSTKMYEKKNEKSTSADGEGVESKVVVL